MRERDRQAERRGGERSKRERERERGERKKERDSGQKNINTDDYVDKRKVNRLRA